MIRRIVMVGCLVLLTGHLVITVLSWQQVKRLVLGSPQVLPLTEIRFHGFEWLIARLSPHPAATSSTLQVRPVRIPGLGWVRWLQGPKGTVRIGGVKYTGGRGFYTDFRAFNPRRPVAITVPSRLR